MYKLCWLYHNNKAIWSLQKWDYLFLISHTGITALKTGYLVFWNPSGKWAGSGLLFHCWLGGVLGCPLNPFLEQRDFFFSKFAVFSCRILHRLGKRTKILNMKWSLFNYDSHDRLITWIDLFGNHAKFANEMAAAHKKARLGEEGEACGKLTDLPWPGQLQGKGVT